MAEHVSRPDYESINLVESVQYWRTYRPLTYYEMVAAAVLDIGRGEF